MATRRASRVDENQPEIVAGLRRLGFSVQLLHAVGDGCPDILVGDWGLNMLLEIKNPRKIPSQRKLTADQVKWHDEWKGPKAVVETLEEAVDAIHQARQR